MQALFRLTSKGYLKSILMKIWEEYYSMNLSTPFKKIYDTMASNYHSYSSSFFFFPLQEFKAIYIVNLL